MKSFVTFVLLVAVFAAEPAFAHHVMGGQPLTPVITILAVKGHGRRLPPSTGTFTHSDRQESSFTT